MSWNRGGRRNRFGHRRRGRFSACATVMPPRVPASAAPDLSHLCAPTRCRKWRKNVFVPSGKSLLAHSNLFLRKVALFSPVLFLRLPANFFIPIRVRCAGKSFLLRWGRFKSLRAGRRNLQGRQHRLVGYACRVQRLFSQYRQHLSTFSVRAAQTLSSTFSVEAEQAPL